MALQNSAKNETSCRGHLFERVRVQMKKGIAVEPFRAGGRQSNTGADMNQRRNVELLRQFPERPVCLMIEIAVAHGVRRNKQSAMTQFTDGALRLFHCHVWFLKWNHGNAEQSLFIWRTMFGQPIVISAKQCGRELRLAHTAKSKRVCGKKRNPVDPFGVHHLEASLRVGSQLKKILATGFGNKSQWKTTYRPVVTRAIAILQSRGPGQNIKERRIQVTQPDVMRFKHMRIGVNNFLGPWH